VTGRYTVLAGRIRQDLADLERVVERVERAGRARRAPDAEQDLLLDAMALNLHDFYSGLERIFTHIASNVDESVPVGPDWHRELLKQMTVDVVDLRSPVLDAKVAGRVDESLRFRHVVRDVYAIDLEPDRVEHLASRLRPAFHDVKAALIAHAAFLEGLAQ
jgi:hypothetical protein